MFTMKSLITISSFLVILGLWALGPAQDRAADRGQDRAADRAQEKASDKSIAAKTAGMRKIDGYLPLYWDEASGRLLMEISRFQKEFLYQVSLPAGVGSNPLGLDRGQLGGTHIVYFEKAGPKVLLISANYRYRALGGDAAERRSVEDSFARSVIWGFKI